MAVGDDTVAYRRDLPHLQKRGKTYFVTFRTYRRLWLSSQARDLVLDSCIYDHQKLCWIHCVVVMPDHVHMLTTPFPESTLEVILRRLKGASGHRVNQLMNRHGKVWQRESFDHILRTDEKVRQKAEYILANPVRAGLVTNPALYRWWWRADD